MRSPVANYHVSYETHSGKRKNPLSLQNHSSSQTQRILSSASKFTSCSGLLGFDRCLSSQLSFLCAVCPKQDPILHPRFVLFLGRLPHISKLWGGGMLMCKVSIVGPIQNHTSQAIQFVCLKKCSFSSSPVIKPQRKHLNVETIKVK